MGERKPQVIFVFGGPGAGKGTQCEKIAREFGFVHFSVGQLLRDATTNNREIAEYMERGDIVPVHLTMKLIEHAMHSSPNNTFLLDGFPRDIENLSGWNEQMTGKADIKFALFFDCPKEVCLERVVKRGQSSGRADDNRDAFPKRYKQHIEITMPVVRQLEEEGLVQTISSIPPADQVFEEVKKLFHDNKL